MVPNLDKGVNEFYDRESKGLKLKYQRLIDYEEMILGLAESSVMVAEKIKSYIKTTYLA